MYKSVMKMIRGMYEWVEAWAATKWATPALFIVSFTESSFFLVPPDVLIIAMGAGRPKRALWFAFVTTVASVLGALLGYWIGATLWQSVQDYFFEFAFTVEQFNRVKGYFDENTFMTILIAAFTPIPFKAFTVVGGIIGVPLAPFILGSIVGRSVRYFFLGGLFFVFGEPIKAWIDKHFERATLILGVLFVVLAGVYWYVRHA